MMFNFTENRKTFVTQITRGGNTQTRETLNNLSEGKSDRQIDSALRTGVKKGENNVLYSNKGEVDVNGNSVLGFNDKNSKGIQYTIDDKGGKYNTDTLGYWKDSIEGAKNSDRRK